MNAAEFKKMFQEVVVNPNWEARMTSSKAFKDVVGESYEAFEKKVWEALDPGVRCLDQAQAKAKYPKLTKMYNVDLVVEKNGKPVALVECKGHYVDKCFFLRALQNFKQATAYRMGQGLEPLPFVVSCPTTYSKFSEVLDGYLQVDATLYGPEAEKVSRYLHDGWFVVSTVCEHDRVGKKKYYNKKDLDGYHSKTSPMTFDDDLVEKKLEMMRSLCK